MDTYLCIRQTDLDQLGINRQPEICSFHQKTNMSQTISTDRRIETQTCKSNRNVTHSGGRVMTSFPLGELPWNFWQKFEFWLLFREDVYLRCSSSGRRIRLLALYWYQDCQIPSRGRVVKSTLIDVKNNGPSDGKRLNQEVANQREASWLCENMWRARDSYWMPRHPCFRIAQLTWCAVVWIWECLDRAQS